MSDPYAGVRSLAASIARRLGDGVAAADVARIVGDRFAGLGEAAKVAALTAALEARQEVGR
jgi:hypothetical protein